MIDARKANAFAARLDKFLAEISKEMDLSFDTPRVRYDGGKIDVAVRLEPANVAIEDTPAGRAFLRYASTYGLDAKWLGAEFVSGRQRMRVLGLNTNRPKNPVELKDVFTGKTYKASASYLRQNLAVFKAA